MARALWRIGGVHRIARRLWFLVPSLLAMAVPAPGQQGGAPPAADAGPPAAALTEADLQDGDEIWASAQATLARARSEPRALRALATVVNLERRRGDSTAGLAEARDGLARARKLGDVRMQVEFLYLLGRLYWNLTDYPHSLESHLEELRLAGQLGDAALLARTHSGLGVTCQRYGRSADALEHFRLGLKFAVQAGDDRMRASLLNSLGSYYYDQKDYDQAAAMHEDALEIREGFGNRRAIADSLTSLGLVANARGDPATALAYLQRALATYEVLKFRRYIARSHRRLALVLRQAGRLDEAAAHLQTALQVAGTLESAEVMADIYQECAAVQEARGDFVHALEFQRKFADANERMRNERDRQQMGELRARYAAEQKELEIALLKRDQELQTAELRRRRSQNLMLVAGLGGGVLLLGAIIMLQRFRLRAERRVLAVTEHARERAEAAERLKSRLLQIASHDLKVPLSALNATAGIIGRNPTDEAAVRRLAGGIQADTARMRLLVRDFLDAAAIEDGNLQLQAAPQDLAAIARSALESLEAVAAAKRQRLALVPAARALPPVSADGERLRQVFDNLIGNALKFTPPGGEVTVALGEAGGWAFAEVRDSGPGLGPADFAKIFAPYQRLSAKPTGEGEDSMGLGLFIARELLTLQGGRLEVQSQPGHGAVFRVLLPLAAARGAE
jgi:signal transduction histidine kinase